MYLRFLECFPDEAHLVDIFEYVRMSTDNILKVGAWVGEWRFIAMPARRFLDILGWCFMTYSLQVVLVLRRCSI